MSNASATRSTIKSIDGTREITVEEFDRMFDDASDEIDDFIDWSRAVRNGTKPGTVRLSFDLPRGLLGHLHAEADRRGLPRDDLLAEWVAERLRTLGASPARDHAAE